MKIGIVGGTGGMGRGFALRWCPHNDILIGSRDAARAAEAAGEYGRLAAEAYGSVEGSITGYGNAAAAAKSDVLVLCIGYENIDATCSELLPLVGENCVVVSPIVPMIKTEVGFEFIPMMGRGEFAHRMVERHMEKKDNLVSAFHVISEKKLANPAQELNYDIFICGQGSAVDTVSGLIGQIDGLRPIYLGPGSLAYMAEIATPLLLNAMIRNRIKNPGIKII